MSIAKHTGIGGAPRQVFIHEIVDHKSAKFFPDVKNIMRKSMLHGSHASIVKAVYIAAACFFFATTTGGVVPCFHGDANDLIAFIVEHQGSNSTVNTPAHCYQHFSFTAHQFEISWQIYVG